MKIAIVAPSPVPFTAGGVEQFLPEMQNAIKKFTPHQCELIKIPIKEDSFWHLIDSYRRFFCLDLSHFDMVISTKYPSWMVQHRNHSVYLIHHIRGLFDTYHSFNIPEKIPEDLLSGLVKEIASLTSQLHPTNSDVNTVFEKLEELENNQKNYPDAAFEFPGPFIREIIHFLDRYALEPGRIQHYYAMSQNVRNRKEYFPGDVSVGVIYPPPMIENFRYGTYEYLFTASRLDSPKRIGLLIKSLEHVPHDIKFKIAGEGPEEQNLKKLAEHDKRIEFVGYVSENELRELYSDALAILYAPYDEDYGLITIEGMMSKKPIISTTDSGGPLEFILDGKTGYIVDPNPLRIAEKINYLIENKTEAVLLGERGYDRVKDITWQTFIRGLFRDPNMNLPKKKKILILSTYPCYPPRGGGQQRLYNIYTRLAGEYDITLCSITESNKESQNLELPNGLRQVCIPQSQAHAEAQWKMESKVRKNLYDVAMIEHVQMSEEYVDAVKSLMIECDIVIFSHPYLFSLYPCVGKGKFVVYDAIDVEYFQKKEFIKDKVLLTKISEIERKACTDSDMVWTTSPEDREAIADLYRVPRDKITIIPNGTDTSSIKFISHEEKMQTKTLTGISENKTVLFVGSWHPPNLGALAFINDTLARKFKDVTFLVVGSVRDYFLSENRKFQENVLAFGVVDELEIYEIYKIADIALNPMSSGSGTNLKILDYMSAGIPVITTPTGARGLELSGGVDALICRLLEFPGVMEKLLSDDELQESLRCHARRKIECKYSWDTIAAAAWRSLEGRGL